MPFWQGLPNNGAPTPFQAVSGNYYFPGSQANSQAIATMGNGTLRTYPVYLPAMTIATLSARVTIAGTASNLRLGIYADNGAGAPGALLFDSGPGLDGTVVGAQEVACGLAIQGGWYWLAAVLQGAPATQPTVEAINANDTNNDFPISFGTALPVGGVANSYFMNGQTGALPAQWVGTSQTTFGLRIAIKAL